MDGRNLHMVAGELHAVAAAFFLNYPLESDLIPLTKELHRRLARDMGIVGQTPWGGRA